MAGFAAMAMSKDPALRPSRVEALAYLAGVLNNIGATFAILTSPETRVWGLGGWALVGAGIIGFIDGLVIMTLGLLWANRKKPGWAGAGIIILSIAGVVTSLWGLFLTATALGIYAGYSINKEKRQVESLANAKPPSNLPR